ncbi:HAD family hydrolase [Thermomonospora cellulosilytica]|uniref:Putative hydrolase of the HAD superfamily n=1 Tax=Thermomonospora cellulosilytica TaxID=1411118 RepID=A0A7W3N3P6_9ACTN|nr:HAD family hydrolase [Thermomonospora cellulosilytica]MBA9007001.1 putative hydrolase of the HAD superfamily [Thermomonospora cellulosilytica]
MAVDAVIFDWGGTLTPWHDIELGEIWRRICAAHLDPHEVEETAGRLLAAEEELWRRSREEHRSATLDELFEIAGVRPTEAMLAAKFQAWEPHTFIDPDAPALLEHLRSRGIRVGVLSNTVWSREWHERIFDRDGVLPLIDGAVYSSEIPWTKPHAEAFRAAMDAVGADDPARCVFVGDRPFEDVHGAKTAGMRAVQVWHGTADRLPGTRPDLTPPDVVVHRLADLKTHIDAWHG